MMLSFPVTAGALQAMMRQGMNTKETLIPSATPKLLNLKVTITGLSNYTHTSACGSWVLARGVISPDLRSFPAKIEPLSQLNFPHIWITILNTAAESFGTLARRERVARVAQYWRTHENPASRFSSLIGNRIPHSIKKRDPQIYYACFARSRRSSTHHQQHLGVATLF